jgi:hypothetical protein
MKTKQEELTLMQNSHLRTLTTHVKNLRNPITWLNTWDYASNLHYVSFNTLMPPPAGNPLITSIEMDLRPLKNTTIYKVKIKRN